MAYRDVSREVAGPLGKTRTGDAMNRRGLQPGTGATFQGVPQLLC